MEGSATRFGKIQAALCDKHYGTPGLTIGSGSKKAVKLANTIFGVSNGVLQQKTTAEVAISGSCAHGNWNIFLVFLAAGGTLSVVQGTEAATLAAVGLPATPSNAICIGGVIVNPTGTGAFTGGTTDLDDGTVTPNALYFDGNLNTAPFSL
jgi:hypothetical protein